MAAFNQRVKLTTLLHLVPRNLISSLPICLHGILHKNMDKFTFINVIKTFPVAPQQLIVEVVYLELCV
jgi:hypothetical protein